MSESKIEWTGRSDWNPIRGCTRVSPGCGGPGRHGGCYAEAIAARFSDEGQAFHGFATRTAAGGRWTGKVEVVVDRLTLPLRWRKPATIFASSTSDVFHEALSDDDIDRIFAVMALTPHHTYQVLTKRAARMRAYMTRLASGYILRLSAAINAIGDEAIAAADRAGRSTPRWPLPNVWLGVSVEDQQRADERVGWLLDTPASLRFLSCEPLLGPLTLTQCADAANPGHTISALTGWGGFDHPRPGSSSQLPRIGWVIVGGESGPRARPLHPAWVRDIREQCRQARVPFFFKQWGEWVPLAQNGAGFWPADEGGCIRLTADGMRSQAGWPLQRVGKKAAGRVLDGAQHDGIPS